MKWAVAGCCLAALLGASACRRTVEVTELHADFREIWKGYEDPETGKEARADAKVTLEFSAKPKPNLVVGAYYPTEKVARFEEHGRPDSCGDVVGAVRSRTEPNEPGIFSNAFAVGATRPNAITLAASQPLIKGCIYEFRIESGIGITDTGRPLGKRLTVRFRVGPANLWRELTNVRVRQWGMTRFSARAGVNTPVADALARYHVLLDVAGAELVPDKTGPTFYHQYAHGYRVDEEGYFVTSEHGMFRSLQGHAVRDVPKPPAPTLDSAAALHIALPYLNVPDPPSSHPPAGELYLRVLQRSSGPPVTRLVWGFPQPSRRGSVEPRVTVDATTGTLVDIPGPRFVE